MLVDIDEAFNKSTAPWFRGRTWHEYHTVRSAVRTLVDLDSAKILDFGCGDLPVAVASMALRHPKARFYGTDISEIDPERLKKVLNHESGLPVPDNLQVQTVPPNSLPESLSDLDLIYSWSVFEHIPAEEVVGNLRLIGERLSSNGVFFFQIGGLYFHDLGSHLKHLFPEEPWHHLVYSLEELRERVFAAPIPEASRHRLWQQFMELNRLTSADFLDAANDAGLRMVWSQDFQNGSPPARLLRSYSKDALTTHEIRAVFRRK